MSLMMTTTAELLPRTLNLVVEWDELIDNPGWERDPHERYITVPLSFTSMLSYSRRPEPIEHVVLSDVYVLPFGPRRIRRHGFTWITVAFPQGYVDHLADTLQRSRIPYRRQLRYGGEEVRIGARVYDTCRVYLDNRRIKHVRVRGRDVYMDLRLRNYNLLDAFVGSRNFLPATMELRASLKWAGSERTQSQHWRYEFSFEAISLDIE
ncbi:hypothetical protein OC835_005120 [Tilletia horrida]|uniref:Uncharacterized protein n=1 Tax=Tilletia horrida TaxID=155126 RepID=A0AAN6GET3_9BASI|nr:hypothetical protein OC835_005120 [Tilletia horrida]KAK0529504.1 hypothetical protein OC842_004211 [Tilletia horrida]